MTGWRRTFVAGLFTGLTSLLLFGLAHMVFITPLTEPAGNPLWMRLGVMFAAPVLVGLVPTAIATVQITMGWRVTRASGRLGPGRFGVALAGALASPAVASFALRPSYEAGPAGAVVLAVLAGSLVPAAAAGAWAGSWRGSLALGLGTVPVAAMLVLFFLPELWRGNPFVLLFFASIAVILGTSGVWMARFEALLQRGAREHEPQSGIVPSSPEGTAS